jgi:hypothetical protein
VLFALSILLGVGLAASIPGSVAGAVPSASGLASEARQIQAQAVADGTKLHTLATEVAQAGARLQALDAEITSDTSTLQTLQSKLAQASSTLREVALAQYMQDTSATGLSEFLGSPTESAATNDYQQLATGNESDAQDAYQQAEGAVARQDAALAAEQAAAADAYQAATNQYAALLTAAQSEEAALAKVRHEEAYLDSQGAPTAVNVDNLVGGDGSLAEDFYRLRVCESDDNYQDDTGNGYYGAYQFALSTWEGLGYSGLPSDAPPPQQDGAAYQLYQRDGWSQWPECAAMLGLD